MKFSTKEEVELAIQKLNSAKITDSQIVIEKFSKDKKVILATNIYVKDFPETWNE